MKTERDSITRIINKTYNSKEEQKEKIALKIYNYGFWKGFSIALLIGLTIGVLI